MDYQFKRVDESCYKDLVYLFKCAFEQTVTEEYYRNKMDTKYLGVQHHGFLAYTQNNEPAAFYGVFPTMMEYKGKSYLAAQSGDTMTHPSHTGKGLFTTLAKMTYDLAKQDGIQFIFGFPNGNSYPGFVKKLNWIHKENMTNYKIRVATLPLAAIAKKFGFIKPIYKIYSGIILNFFKSDECPDNSAINANYGGVLRNKEFVNYKSFYDNHIVNIGDRTVWVKIDGALVIGDIEWKEQNETEIIIARIKKLAFWLGCNQVIFAVGKNTAWDILLKDKVPSEEGIYIGYLDLQSGLPLENFKFVMADMDTF